ncbi:Hsp70 family protein [Pseudonocardia thermophila]|uniref:Hsp70 family protein n=1 Tax=Pseudonocardia thermophila TaxID=1848 RepID=UPI00248F00E5|nr:Hsp70 family protein [Pseudonocardia thermophila]
MGTLPTPPPRPGYHLGIDLGSTWTTAAVARAADARPEPVSLGGSATAIPTIALLTEAGELLVGEAAQRRAATEPQRVARGFTRRIGDHTPLVLGDRVMRADEIAARFVTSVVGLVTAREGGAPDGIAVTHPAGWGAHRCTTLREALTAAGLSDVQLVAEPVAAALGHTGPAGLEPDTLMAVYDLGGGTFSAAVLAGDADGTPVVRGLTVGLDGVGGSDLGGVDFDEQVLAHVREAIGDAWDPAWDQAGVEDTDPDVLAAVAALRRECTSAKEALSADVDSAVQVMLPGVHTRVRIARADFEDRIRPQVAETVPALRRALAAAGIDATALHTVLLVGGSSRIPLVPQLVSAGLGRPVTVDSDPRTTAARGAALAAQRAAAAVAAAAPAAEPATPVPAPAPAPAPEVVRPAAASSAPAAPPRPDVPDIRRAAVEWPEPERRTGRGLRLRVALLTALVTTGIAGGAAALAYTVDPTLLSGETPAVISRPAAPAEQAAEGAQTATADAPAEVEPPEQAPAAQPRPAAPQERSAVQTGRAATAPQPPAQSAPAPAASAPNSSPAAPAPATVPEPAPADGSTTPSDPGPGTSPNPDPAAPDPGTPAPSPSDPAPSDPGTGSSSPGSGEGTPTPPASGGGSPGAGGNPVAEGSAQTAPPTTATP